MSKIKLEYLITNNDDGFKVAHVLRDRLDISARLLTKLKMDEKILINGKPVFSNYIVHEGELLTVLIDFNETDYIPPEKMDLDIIYEDEYLLAINKPANRVVHPSANHQTETLANGVKFYLHNNKKIRPINRLDKDTSGITLFAKNEFIQELMNTKVSVYKEYLSIVNGTPDIPSGTINLPIGRKLGSIMERCVTKDGQTAITHYEVIKKISNNLTLIKLVLETGRTHQIRVHLSYMGMPILGDTLYGEESDLINRQALHAYKMKFVHPITKKEIEIIASIPEDIQRLIK